MKAEFSWNGNKILKELEQIKETLLEELDKVTGRYAHEIRNEAIENLDEKKINNTGDLRKSIQAAKLARGVYQVQVGELYGVFVEYGTSPHMPPVDEIEKWVVRKLGLKGKEARKTAWAIALQIKKHGTKAKPFFRPAVKKLIPEWFRAVEETVHKTLR